MITYPISSNFCNVIGFTIFHFSEAPTRGVLRYFAKFAGKHLWQSLFFKVFFKVSLSCLLLLDISCSFYFNIKMKWKKGNTLAIYFFARVSVCLTSKISKEIWHMVIWSENVFKRNLMFTWHTGKPGHGTLVGPYKKPENRDPTKSRKTRTQTGINYNRISFKIYKVNVNEM